MTAATIALATTQNARTVRNAPNRTAAIPAGAIPECKNGVTSDDYSPCLVVTRDRVSGVTLWTWYVRPFLDSATILQYPRESWQARDPETPPTLESIPLAAYLPPNRAIGFAGGLYRRDDPALPDACRRDAKRYFPSARIATPDEIEAVHLSLAKRPYLFGDDVADVTEAER